jgi:hypothetical protein
MLDSITPEIIDGLEVSPLGKGYFAVADLGVTYTVSIRHDRSLTCTCRAVNYNQRCVHQAATLTYITQFKHLPEQVEIPEPIDVAHIEATALYAYLMALNRAHNVLTVKKIAAMRPLTDRVSRFKYIKNTLAQLKILKASPEQIVDAMKALIEAEALRDLAQLEYDIIAAHLEDVQTATMRAQSVLKKL